MGKVIAIEHLTLDGVMQSPGRPDEDTRDGFTYGGWAGRGQDPAMQQVMGTYMSGSWSLLAGRRTYEDFAAHWPRQAPNPMTDALNRVDKYVVSGTLTGPLGWQNSTLLADDDAVDELKQDVPENLVIFGSGVLVRSLLARDLVGTLVLLTHPLVLGAGRRLFPDSGPKLPNFHLAHSTTTSTGVIIGVYQPTDQ